MPSKFVIREYCKDGYYHIFNRGVEKRNIFLDSQDYKIFLYYLFIYLSPLEKVFSKYSNHPLRLQSKNLYKEVELIAYCLMPNHFHLLVKQNTINGVSKLMKQLANAYTMYFNNKYKRVGGLMQGRFKAVRVKTDEQLVHVSRYIHLNPLIAKSTDSLDKYDWSSFKNYLGCSSGIDCKKEIILSQSSLPNDYKKFVMDQSDYLNSLNLMGELALDLD